MQTRRIHISKAVYCPVCKWTFSTLRGLQSHFSQVCRAKYDALPRSVLKREVIVELANGIPVVIERLWLDPPLEHPDAYRTKYDGLEVSVIAEASSF
jgi:hypothetical protein